MTQRKYSIDEIDSMRESVAAIEDCGGRRGALTEEKLRTYMLNGTDPAELNNHAAKVQNAYWRQLEGERAARRSSEAGK